MKENIEVFDFALSEEEMIKIKTLDIEKREDSQYRLEKFKKESIKQKECEVRK